MKTQTRKQKRQRRHARIRAKVFGTGQRPRLVVFRSHKHFSVQVIDDEKRHTIFALSDKNVKKFGSKPQELATELGKLLAQKAKEKKIEHVVFDRAGYAYHGSVKAFAEGAREGGLKF